MKYWSKKHNHLLYIVMAILQSCCCFQSLRTGCYASAIYAMVYFSLNTGIIGFFLHIERPYWTGNGTAPQSKSFLEPEIISEITVIFHIVVLFCGGFGLLTCIILLLGIYFDIKVLFLPWIFAMITATAMDVAYSVYLFRLDTVEFTPLTAILYTTDFFLLTLNVHSVLCVISQFQELTAGRGTANFEQTLKISSVRYTCQPTATSCLSSKRPITMPSPTQSPTKTTGTIIGSSSIGSRRGSKKHVQFPDLDVTNLKSNDLLHANWKQGVSTLSDISNTPDSSNPVNNNRTDDLNVEALIITQNYPKPFVTHL